MSIVVSQSGQALEGYEAGEGITRLAAYPDLPLVFACVAARYQGEILFVYNNYRQLWELPAGHIDAGETAEEACTRELMEESGQMVAAMKQTGVALMRVKDVLEPGAIFTCELVALADFMPNPEIREIMLWDMRRPVDGEVDLVSLKLLELMSV